LAGPECADRSAEGFAKVKYVRTAKSPPRDTKGLFQGKKHSPTSKAEPPAVSRFTDKENMPLLISKIRKVEELKKNSTQSKEARHFEKAEQLFQWRDAIDRNVERRRKQCDLELARSRSKKRLSSKELAKSCERLYETAFILEKKREITAKASNEFSFKPQINQKSIKIAKNQQIRNISRPSLLIKQSTSIPKMSPTHKMADAINKSASKHAVDADDLRPHSHKHLRREQPRAGSASLDLLEEDQQVFCTTQDQSEDSGSVNQEMKIEGVNDSEPKASNITETEDDLEYVETIAKMHQMRYDGDISVDVFEDHRLPRPLHSLQTNSQMPINFPTKDFSFMMASGIEQGFSKKPGQPVMHTSGKRESSPAKNKSRDSSIKSSNCISVAIIPNDIADHSLANSSSVDRQQLSSPQLQTKGDNREVLAAIDLLGSFSSKKTPRSNLLLVSDKKQPVQPPIAEKRNYRQRDLLEIMRNLCQDVDNTMHSKHN
jgi:hypothetical protein